MTAGSMKKKNRTEWFNRIAELAQRLPSDSIGLEFSLNPRGASEAEIRYELKSRGVEFSIRQHNGGSWLIVYPPRKNKQ